MVFVGERFAACSWPGTSGQLAICRPARRHGRKAPDRKALHRSTLERRYDFHLGEAIRATLQGSHDKAAGHSGQALLISRELYADTADPARHKPELAAALCAHASTAAARGRPSPCSRSPPGNAALAEDDPAAYEVPRIDVLTRIALASDAAGSTPDAVALLREVVGMYLKAPAADTEECLSAWPERASTSAASCSRWGWTRTGSPISRPALSSRPTCSTGSRLRVRCPRLARRGPPLPPAGRARLGGRRGRVMTLHAAAARWQQAATAARAAVAFSAGLPSWAGSRCATRTRRSGPARTNPRARRSITNARYLPDTKTGAAPWNTHPFS